MELRDKFVVQNDFINEVKRIHKLGGALYVLGDGWGSRNIIEILKIYNLAIDGILVNREYIEHSDVICLEDFFEKSETAIYLIIGIVGYDIRRLDKYHAQIAQILSYDTFFPFKDELNVSKNWLTDNYCRIRNVYEHLSDDLSRRTLIAFINQRISLNWKYLMDVKSSDEQYFEKGIIHLNEDEYFVDCGAYDGDSAAAFIDALNRAGIHSYRKIISFEPDADNYKKLCDRKLKNHLCLKKGLSDREEILCFSSGMGTSSNFGDGSEYLEVTSIDKTLGDEQATFIKMDIEGFEMKAIHGAENVIKKNRPKLAICAYHKINDLFEIPELLLQYHSDYSLYLRAYEYRTTELVLYAI